MPDAALDGDDTSAERPSSNVTDIDELRERAAQLLSEAQVEAKRIRSSAEADADRTRTEARRQAEALLSGMSAHLAEMGAAYREAIREARKTVQIMADSIRDNGRTGEEC